MTAKLLANQKENRVTTSEAINNKPGLACNAVSLLSSGNEAGIALGEEIELFDINVINS